MDERDWLAERFEEHRGHLRAVAYRMLGSLSEADDAVQESWLRLSRSDTSEVENLRAWLTTVVARVSLNVLRSRRTRREEPLDVRVPDPVVEPRGRDRSPSTRRCWPTRSGWRCSSCSTRSARPSAWPSCCTTCSACRSTRSRAWWTARRPRPASSPAARDAGSRAPRRRPTPTCAAQRRVVDAFFAAARDGDFDALVAVLDPDVVSRGRRRSRRLRGRPRRARGRRAGAHLRAALAVRPPGAGQRRRRRRRGPARRAVLGHGLHGRGREDRRDRRDHRPRAPARAGPGRARRLTRVRARWRARPRRPAAPTPAARQARADRRGGRPRARGRSRRRPRRSARRARPRANSMPMTGSRRPWAIHTGSPGRSRSALQPSTVGMKPLMATIPAGVGRPAPSPRA